MSTRACPRHQRNPRLNIRIFFASFSVFGGPIPLPRVIGVSRGQRFYSAGRYGSGPHPNLLPEGEGMLSDLHLYLILCAIRVIRG